MGVATYAPMKRIKRANRERDRDSKESPKVFEWGGEPLSPSLSTRLIPDEKGTESRTPVVSCQWSVASEALY